jgi:hypothetical protein
MDLCRAFPEPGCVGTGEAAVGTTALHTAFLGTCTAAHASKRGACALVHYDDMRAGMYKSALECARAFGDSPWCVVRGPKATRSWEMCVAAIEAAGAVVARTTTADEARVEPGA